MLKNNLLGVVGTFGITIFKNVYKGIYKTLPSPHEDEIAESGITICPAKSANQNPREYFLHK